MDGLLQSLRRLPPTGRGQEDSALAFLLPECLSYKQEFQDLTPCCTGAGEGLTHFYITLIPAQPQPLVQRESLGHGPTPQFLDKSFPAPFLWPRKGRTWS